MTLLTRIMELGNTSSMILRTTREQDTMRNLAVEAHKQRVRGAIFRYRSRNPWQEPYGRPVETMQLRSAHSSLEKQR